MADIDFDELDKAVNTLMSGAKQPSTSTVAEPAKDESESVDNSQEPPAPVTQEATQPEEDKPTAEASENDDQKTGANEAVKPEAPETPEPAAEGPAAAPVEQKSLATKRRGQFMDMKHPSADMKTTSAADPAKAPRVGVTIAPLNESDKRVEQPATPEPVTEKPVEAQDEIETPEIEIPEVPMPAGASDVKPAETVETPDETQDEQPPETAAQPEPISEPANEPHLAPAPERSKESEKPAEATVETPTTEAPSSPEPEPTPEPETTPAPPESTSDSEPEATPKSAPADEAAATDESTTTSPFLPDAKVEKRPLGQPAQSGETAAEAEPEAPDGSSSVSLPDELHDSVLAVEADTTINKATDADEATDNASSTDESDKPADVSIPHQYKTSNTENTESNEPDMSMYDTAVQHDAFAASPKRSHWVIVLGIIAIIILGAAIGAGAYVLQAGLI